MSKRIRINESQLEMLVKADRSRLRESTGMDVLMGAASLMGIKLTGFNQKVAKEALSSPKTLNTIKQYLETEKIDDLVTSLEEKGMANAKDKLEADAHKIQNKFNDIAFDTEGVSGGLIINLGD